MTRNSARPAAPAGDAGTTPAQAAAGADLDPDRLRGIVADVLGIAPDVIADDDNLVALGVDSVKAMTISTELRRYRTRVRFARMIEEPTLAAWWRLATEGTGDGGRAA
ncbi:phosphopantetheine-binding protein [Streptomyces sp. NBC_01477]|uniref:phosphopantetheine-binding protein n=1 Tax=Streptomyces sp. NBC_01477 TaxID=2976015 RepID=UPI002E37BD03|nr:phosphopantetheine-binding protein [Streptomyces sp. NBC_01477]